MVKSDNSGQDSVQCDKVWREISNYIDGEVDASLRTGMEEHFKTCARCASLLAGMSNVIHLYGDERMLELPVGFSQRLENLLDARVARKAAARVREFPSKLQPRRWSSWSAWLVPVGAVALFAFTLALVGTFTLQNSSKTPMAEQGKDIPPDMLVVVSSGAKLFHVPGCEFIHDKSTERTITAKQAIEDGYAPCPRCLRQYLKSALGAGLPGGEGSEDANVEEDRGKVLGEGLGEGIGKITP